MPVPSEAAIDAVLKAIKLEYAAARTKFPPMYNPHEGMSIIREEFEEAWDEVKHNHIYASKQEMLQVAAMALAYLLEIE